MIILKLNIFILTYFAASTKSFDPHVVNINLETLLEFNNKDKTNDLKVLNDLEEFISKLKELITNNGRRQNEGPMKFSGFLKNAVDIIKTYKKEDLEHFVAVLYNEIRNFNYEGCRFHELMQHEEVRRYLDNTLATVHNKNGFEVKEKLNFFSKALEEAHKNKIGSELLDFIDSLYGKESEHKFEKFLSEIWAYKTKSKRINLNLIDIIKNGIRSIIFDHYSKLIPNARNTLRQRFVNIFKEKRNWKPTSKAKVDFWVKWGNFFPTTPSLQPFTPNTIDLSKLKDHNKKKLDKIETDLDKAKDTLEEAPFITDLEKLYYKKLKKDLMPNKKDKDSYLTHHKNGNKKLRETKYDAKESIRQANNSIVDFFNKFIEKTKEQLKRAQLEFDRHTDKLREEILKTHKTIQEKIAKGMGDVFSYAENLYRNTVKSFQELKNKTFEEAVQRSQTTKRRTYVSGELFKPTKGYNRKPKNKYHLNTKDKSSEFNINNEAALNVRKSDTHLNLTISSSEDELSDLSTNSIEPSEQELSIETKPTYAYYRRMIKTTYNDEEPNLKPTTISSTNTLGNVTKTHNFGPAEKLEILESRILNYISTGVDETATEAGIINKNISLGEA